MPWATAWLLAPQLVPRLFPRGALGVPWEVLAGLWEGPLGPLQRPRRMPPESRFRGGPSGGPHRHRGGILWEPWQLQLLELCLGVSGGALGGPWEVPGVALGGPWGTPGQPLRMW